LRYQHHHTQHRANDHAQNISTHIIAHGGTCLPTKQNQKFPKPPDVNDPASCRDKKNSFMQNPAISRVKWIIGRGAHRPLHQVFHCAKRF
jgi:hypothetical protein